MMVWIHVMCWMKAFPGGGLAECYSDQFAKSG